MKKLPKCNTPNDLDSWFEEISEIKQLNRPDEPPTPPLIIKEIEPSLCGEGFYNHNSFNNLEVGNINNIDKNTATRFLKGQFKIDAKIDLHGYREKEAFEIVQDFLTTCYIKGMRCLLIITGKGIKKEEDPWYEARGVIKEALPRWLNHPDIRPMILSVTQAKQEDGGSGAFYILLKRQRSHK